MIIIREKKKAEESQAGTPRIGIFWLHKENNNIEIFYSTDKSIQDSPSVGNTVYPSVIHSKAWNDLRRNKFVPFNSEFTDLPRGKINFDKKTRRFEVLVGGYLLNNTEAKKVIRAEFNLPSSTTDWSKNPEGHYEKFKIWFMKKG